MDLSNIRVPKNYQKHLDFCSSPVAMCHSPRISPISWTTLTTPRICVMVSWPGLVLGEKVLHIIALDHESADELKRNLLVCWDPQDSGWFVLWENHGKAIKRGNGQLPEAIWSGMFPEVKVCHQTSPPILSPRCDMMQFDAIVDQLLHIDQYQYLSYEVWK